MDHIAKWKDKHWLFGFYTSRGNALRFTRYASPAMIAPWIEQKRQYISADYGLARVAPEKLNLTDLFRIVGKKSEYTEADAKRLQKQQLSAAEYIELRDLPNGYSAERMLSLLRMRCAYVIERGSTLNNPHIPKGVLEAFPVITANHAKELRRLVRQSLKS